MRSKIPLPAGQHRAFRAAAWGGRAIGWTLLGIAIFGIAEATLLPQTRGDFTLLPSLALGLVAIVWIGGLELFLHFFDRYLSRN